MSTNYDDDFNLNDFQEDLNRIENKGTASRFLQIPKEQGAFIVRLLPPRPGEKPYCATRLHYINGKAYHCTRNLEGGRWIGKCAICDEYNGLWNKIKVSKSEDEKKALMQRARGIKPIERYYWNARARKVYNKDTQNTDINVDGVIPFGKTLQGIVLRKITGDEKMQELPLGNVMHPVKGRDFKIAINIKTSPDGKFPDYAASTFNDVSPLGTTEEIEKCLASMQPLQKLRDDELLSNEELQKQVDIFNGKIQDESGSHSHNDDDVPFVPTKINKPSAPVEDASVTEDEFIRELQASLGK